MKIVLSAKELESVKGFMAEYKLSYAESFVAVMPEEMKEQYTVESVIAELDADIQESINKGSSMVVMGQTANGEYVVDIAQDVFMAYMKACKDTIAVTRKYSTAMAKLFAKHKDTIDKSIKRAKCLVDKKFVKNIVTTAAKFLGAEELVSDVLDFGTKICEDKELQEEAERINYEFFESIDKYC